MIKIVGFLLFATVVCASYAGPGYGYSAPAKIVVEKPAPYQFTYEIIDDDKNSQSRQESGDEYGNMKGWYSQQNAEGLSRRVEYVANDEGFRAIVHTNEQGTDNQNPADVEITADPVKVKEAPKKLVKIAPSYHAPASYGYGHGLLPHRLGHGLLPHGLGHGHGHGLLPHGYGHGLLTHGQAHGYGGYQRSYGRTHSYDAPKAYGYGATGHASTTRTAGYGKDGYKHSVAHVHSRRYDAPTYGYARYAPSYGYANAPILKPAPVIKVAEKKEQKKPARIY